MPFLYIIYLLNLSLWLFWKLCGFFFFSTQRENEQRLSERLREVERGKEEEAKRLQDLIDKQKERYQRDIEDMKSTEERLKKELKFTVDEAKRRNFQESLWVKYQACFQCIK